MKDDKVRSCTLRNIKRVDVESYRQRSEILSALSNPTRLAILDITMKYGEVCTCELESSLGIPQSTVTVHLHKLYENGLLKKREEWKFTYYSINETHSDLLRSVLRV